MPPRNRTPSPNSLSGRFASVSAERPTTNTPNVNTAVRKGDENAENSVAIADTMPTSSSVSAAEPSNTRRSSGAAPDNATPAPSSNSAHGIGSAVRQRGSFHDNSTSAATLPSPIAAAGQTPLPDSGDSDSSSAPVSAAMNTSNVSSVPTNFPTRYSLRYSGRARIGNTVFSSSS